MMPALTRLGTTTTAVVLAVAGAAPAQSSHEGLGATPYQDDDGWGTAFRTWAPHADEVWVVGSFNDWTPGDHPLVAEPDGLWSIDVPGIWAGAQYQFVIRNGEDDHWRNDPRARKVTSSVGSSVVVNPDQFPWQHDGGMPDWNETVIYELHPGTFGTSPGDPTFPGTFDGIRDHLDHLQALGVNAIELMPVAEFAGDQSWGYNPAHIFAPENWYGGPEGLRSLVDACHERDMAVMVDLVFNHLGPSDLGCWQFDGWSENDLGGIYFYNDDRANTPWGNTRPNFGKDEVRQWLHDAVMMWLDEYRIDGLRIDGTRWIEWTDEGNNPDGWSWMQWVNDSIDAVAPGKLITAEDMSSNHWITKPTGEGGAGFDAQWDPHFVHPVREAVEAANDDWRNMWSVHDAIYASYNDDPMQRVIYTESHDEVANGRQRVPEAIWPGNADSWYSKKRSTLAATLVFTSPGIPMIFQGQEFLMDGWFDDSEPLDWARADTYAGITTLYRDLIALRRNLSGNTRGLTGSHVNVHHVNDWNKVIGFHRWMDGGAGDDVIVLANFGNTAWDAYRIGVPHGGLWQVRYNSDDMTYDPEFDGHIVADVEAEAIPYDGLGWSIDLGIGPYTAVILSQSPACPADLDGNGAVDVNDLLMIIASWGTPDADVTGDGQTTVDDVLAVLSAFGPCP